MTGGEINSLIVAIALFSWMIGVFVILTIGVLKGFVNPEKEYEYATGLVLTTVAGITGFAVAFGNSAGATVAYLFGVLIGGGAFYYAANYRAAKYGDAAATETEDSSGRIPTYYKNIGEANEKAIQQTEEDWEDAYDDSEDTWAKRISATVDTTIAALLGTVFMLASTIFDPTFPALAIGIGGIIAAGVLFLTEGRTYYAGGGTLYCLFTAAGIQLFGLPDAYAQSPFVVLVTLGGISALIVSAQLGLGLLLQRLLSGVTGEETALRIYEAIAAVIGLIMMIWSVITIHERASRYGGVTIGGTLGMALNFLGIELPIPWIISDGVDAAMVMYVGAVLIGFHTLESLHTTWHATKQTAKAGAEAGRVAGRKSKDVASAARGRLDDE